LDGKVSFFKRYTVLRNLAIISACISLPFVFIYLIMLPGFLYSIFIENLYGINVVGLFMLDSILVLPSFVAVGFYCLSRVQRKKQTDKPPRRVTFSKVFTLFLIGYAVFMASCIHVQPNTEGYLGQIYTSIIFPFGVIVPLLCVLNVVSYGMGRRQRRKERYRHQQKLTDYP